MNQEQQQIFESHLRGKESRPLDREFAELFRGDSNEVSLRRRMKEDWDILPNEVGSKDLTPLLHKLHFLINSQSESFSRKSRLKRMLSWYTRVAAVLLLPLFTISAILFFFSHEPSVQTAKVEVVAPMGARVKTELPDGTIVWLNGGSVLSYSASFEQRNVNVCGKAFFDVKSDSLNPFTVKGNKAAVKVFGTRFNVEMWPDEETVEVVLEEGKVELIPDSCEQSFKMVPGELLVFNFNERKLIRQRVNPKRYSAWIDGKLMLRGEDMRELARELSHWFNADVVVKDSTLSEYTFRATFEDERLEDVLRLLKMTSPIDYEILDNMQDSSGNFSKKKVIIRHQ